MEIKENRQEKVNNMNVVAQIFIIQKSAAISGIFLIYKWLFIC